MGDRTSSYAAAGIALEFMLTYNEVRDKFSLSDSACYNEIAFGN
jgi:hypothetical protein